MIAAAALFVGNKEFREEVKDDLLKERIDNKLKKFDGLIEELLSKQDWLRSDINKFICRKGTMRRYVPTLLQILNCK